MVIQEYWLDDYICFRYIDVKDISFQYAPRISSALISGKYNSGIYTVIQVCIYITGKHISATYIPGAYVSCTNFGSNVAGKNYNMHQNWQLHFPY